MKRRSKDRLWIILIALTVLCLWVVESIMSGSIPLTGIASALALFVLLFFMHRYHYAAEVKRDELVRKVDANYRQVESLVSIVSTIDPVVPLPDMRLWAASPDFLKHTLGEIARRRPKRIVELGSGVSSVVIGYYVKRHLDGQASLVSIEQAAEYAAKTSDLVRVHGLEQVVTVVHADIREVSVGKDELPWYRTDRIPTDMPIDFLVIDGPALRHKEGRYPALPLLHAHLSDEAIVVMDDAGRSGERKIIERWLEEFPGLEHTPVAAEKGCAVLLLHKPKR